MIEFIKNLKSASARFISKIFEPSSTNEDIDSNLRETELDDLSTNLHNVAKVEKNSSQTVKITPNNPSENTVNFDGTMYSTYIVKTLYQPTFSAIKFH
jgi:hypothetical protein